MAGPDLSSFLVPFRPALAHSPLLPLRQAISSPPSLLQEAPSDAATLQAPILGSHALPCSGPSTGDSLISSPFTSPSVLVAGPGQDPHVLIKPLG